MPAARVDRLMAVLALAFACGTAAAADIGTLFHSAEERARLDRIRRGEAVAPATAEGPVGEPRRRELTGYVKRSDGRGTAFIDGEPVPVDPRGAPLLRPDSVRAYASRPSEDLKVERKKPR